MKCDPPVRDRQETLRSYVLTVSGDSGTEFAPVYRSRYALLGSVLAIAFSGLFSEPPSANAQGSAGIPIEHFIFIIQENHSFDNYFGTFPGANGIPVGTALAAYPGGPLAHKPFLLDGTHVPHDLPHGWLPANMRLR
jgi:phospholipase C